MTFVVTEKCIKCKLTDCVEACPVDCFHEGPNMLVINPDECIDCNLCVSQCPIDAIFEEDNLPNDQRHMIEHNAKYAQHWPILDYQKEPLDDSDSWIDAPNKMQYFEE
ncbi:ferredoxin FdxA [Candidatus Synchoanobacter obligatus]|jgi:ferredoxin|uniref:Ferredoxin n=1 Tax=Candidatus Synchoanobacter obligatus TaxID=2919597 RepID=A0ABT1L4R0_9GAMM|nr:ferredoxin FdxA [Candidatus Synchoanobacter obligatus]MCP8352084.1 ferredoxin family protein [Candidatus Synchoanobacter obligatus]